MAALALMTVACSSNDENNFAQQPKTGEGITITAQLAPKSGNAATCALVDKSSHIEAKWAVDEHLAILYEVSGTKYAADARITAVDGTTGAATIEFTVEKLTITTGAQDFVITPAEENSTFFAALPALTEQAVSFVAKGSNSHTYYAANPEFRDLTLAPIRIKLPFPFIL